MNVNNLLKSSNFFLILLCFLTGIVGWFFVKVDGEVGFSCPELITEMQTDSIKQVLITEKNEGDALQRKYEYFNGVVIKLTPMLNELKGKINEVKKQIKEAIKKGENFDALKTKLLGYESQYNESLEKLANDIRQKAIAEQRNPSIKDSLNKVFSIEMRKADSLGKELIKYNNKCNN